MALAFLQLGPAHRGIGCDRVHQVVDLGLASVKLGEGLVADDRIFLVLHQVERAGADRLLVDFLGGAGFEHGVGVLLGLDACVFHGPTRQERGLRLVQGYFERHRVNFFNRLEQLVHAHVHEIGVVGAGDLEVGVAVLPLALDGKNDVIGVHVTRGLEVLVAVPLHALAQEEGVLLAVRRNGPAFRQTRHNGCATTLKFNQAAVDGRQGVKRGPRGVDAG